MDTPEQHAMQSLQGSLASGAALCGTLQLLETGGQFVKVPDMSECS